MRARARTWTSPEVRIVEDLPVGTLQHVVGPVRVSFYSLLVVVVALGRDGRGFSIMARAKKLGTPSMVMVTDADRWPDGGMAIQSLSYEQRLFTASVAGDLDAYDRSKSFSDLA